MSSRQTAAGRRPSLGSLLVATLAGVAGVAGSFALASFTPAFVAGPIAGALARRLPGALVTFAIVVLGDLGDLLNVLLALALAVALFATVALVWELAGTRFGTPVAGLGATATTAALAVAITGAPLASVAAGVGVGVVVAAAGVARTWQGAASLAGVEASDRRRVLAALGSAVPLVVGGYLFGSRNGGEREQRANPDVGEPWSGSAVETLLATARERSLAVDGLEALVSDGFYEVDINSTDPAVDAGEWRLAVTGAVEEPTTYTYEDVAAMEVDHRFVSLRCVGESLNGRKMDNALWTGVPIADLVDPAGPAERCCVMLRAADGYYEEFPLAALREGFLAIGMNGAALPRSHGYPARALIPGHWGEINVKWLTEIEVLDEEATGYWEERGWHGTGPVNTVAKLHVVNHLDGGRVQVGGHAYAGTRGIDRVEVSTDGGDTWADATLSEPLPGTDVWRQWAYTYDAPGETHEVVVRATDGEGTLQSRENASPFPNGPSGWVSETVRQ